VEGEAEIAVAFPARVAEELQACAEVVRGGLIRGPRLGHLAGAQVEPGEIQPLGIVPHLRGAEAQMADHLKQILVLRSAVAQFDIGAPGRDRRAPRPEPQTPEQPADPQVDFLLVLPLDERVGGLEDAVMQEPIGDRKIGLRERRACAHFEEPVVAVERHDEAVTQRRP
jgi:hypothetical protein